MQISRLRQCGVTQFAARLSEQDAWVPVPNLGVEARTTADVIEQSATIRARLAQGNASTLADGQPALECPVVAPSKILAIGLNYLDHIKETGATQPERPILFAKYANALAGPTDPTILDPRLTSELDYEAELAVIIGRAARRLTDENALDSVFGYAVANDVSARDWQRTDAQFSRSKSYDTFCPIGPWLTSADEIADPQDLRITSRVNGEVRQDSTTAQMLFSVRELLVYLSSTMTLYPGDVILTGTPPGVGLGFRPPVFLQPGDTVECEIAGLGRIGNTVELDPAYRNDGR
ncbi:fumarylacetoacetate hydrolase family protein [Rhizomonospora bruguierae]|uniref:fumarylacetoacetate hydrolase family protein n=1 Tax=Rhizomonospora bruguierae TaxID=1581705 RepID=UPI001BCC1E74|nr:fumarylacetoacetate hydrolase family protein [Micromonospora sp. NBRC 107566]